LGNGGAILPAGREICNSFGTGVHAGKGKIRRPQGLEIFRETDRLGNKIQKPRSHPGTLAKVFRPVGSVSLWRTGLLFGGSRRKENLSGDKKWGKKGSEWQMTNIADVWGSPGKAQGESRLTTSDL